MVVSVASFLRNAKKQILSSSSQFQARGLCRSLNLAPTQRTKQANRQVARSSTDQSFGNISKRPIKISPRCLSLAWLPLRLEHLTKSFPVAMYLDSDFRIVPKVLLEFDVVRKSIKNLEKPASEKVCEL